VFPLPTALRTDAIPTSVTLPRPHVRGRRASDLLDVLRGRRRLVSLGALGAATAVAYAGAYWVHFGLAWIPGLEALIGASLVVLVTLRVFTGAACGLSMHRWRFAGVEEIRRLLGATMLGSVLFLPLALRWSPEPGIPGSVLVLEPVFTLVLTAGVWLGYRTVYEYLERQENGRGGTQRKVIVVGAGEAGEALVRQVTLQPCGVRPVAFVDDDPARRGTSIHGVKVLGTTKELDRVAKATGADEIAIAVPSADPEALRRIVGRCQGTGLPFRVLPGIAEVLAGDVSMAQLREVRIEDLLGRDPVDLELPELARDMADQSVLITGAAGSIGSELARQCAVLGPRRLVLLDRSETGLFYLNLELLDLAPDLEIIPAVADVVDAASVERVMTLYRPTRVLHAAAYKHVPMMESNVREALRNNVIGTWSVASAAGRHRVEKFVLVSTDKAVRPANVMGATKRLAEIVVLELQACHPETVFGAVRFGNVLGSAGSVIPIFERQLAEGRPLTVTHPEATRYFMTIPEASQLVLQASLLPDLRGRVAMLDMGSPVRILDLARTLLRLSGRGVDRDAIVFTGLRPGEKLHEELVGPGERSEPTRISKIRVLHPDAASASRSVLSRIREWETMLTRWRLDEVVAEAIRLVPEIADAVQPSRAAPTVRPPRRRPGGVDGPPVRGTRSRSGVAGD
jgi:FlaA1/EpsC-like NDP-sugar epimerase